MNLEYCVLVLCTLFVLSARTDGSSVGEISRQKCREYAKFGEEVKSNNCYFDDRVLTRRSPAGELEFPHMAYMGQYELDNGFRLVCGGSIINEEYILTAAQCTQEIIGSVNVTHVRVGILHVNDTKYLQEIKIVQKIRHPSYKNRGMYNDIALIKLEKLISFNSHVRPACINTSPEIKSKKAVATGWGRTSIIGEYPEKLLKVDLEFYNNTYCNSVYKTTSSRLSNGISEERMICAGSSLPDKDTCQGDSGGPLQIYHDKGEDGIDCMYDIIGIVSFGSGCGEANIPAVYTRVSAYVEWIESLAWPK